MRRKGLRLSDAFSDALTLLARAVETTDPHRGGPKGFLPTSTSGLLRSVPRARARWGRIRPHPATLASVRASDAVGIPMSGSACASCHGLPRSPEVGHHHPGSVLPLALGAPHARVVPGPHRCARRWPRPRQPVARGGWDGWPVGRRPLGAGPGVAGAPGGRRKWWGAGVPVAGAQRIPCQAGGFSPSRRQRPRTRRGERLRGRSALEARFWTSEWQLLPKCGASESQLSNPSADLRRLQIDITRGPPAACPFAAPSLHGGEERIPSSVARSRSRTHPPGVETRAGRTVTLGVSVRSSRGERPL